MFSDYSVGFIVFAAIILWVLLYLQRLFCGFFSFCITLLWILFWLLYDSLLVNIIFIHYAGICLFLLYIIYISYSGDAAKEFINSAWISQWSARHCGGVREIRQPHCQHRLHPSGALSSVLRLDCVRRDDLSGSGELGYQAGGEVSCSSVVVVGVGIVSLLLYSVLLCIL